MGVFTEFMSQQFARVPQLPPVDLSGQTVLVTGVTNVDSLGFASARYLAQMNPARLIITGRTIARCNEAVELLKKDFKGIVEARQLDMNDPESIKTFARSFENKRLDVALLNAGVHMRTWEMAAGHELGSVTSPDRTDAYSLQTNLYGTVHLLLLLHPILAATTRQRKEPARAIVVGSDTMTLVSKLPTDINILEVADSLEQSKQHGLDVKSRYPLTKWCLAASFIELTKRLDSKEVSIALVNPGLCKSKLGRHFKGAEALAVPLMSLIARKLDVGARCNLFPLTVDPAKAHGRYFSSMRDYSFPPFLESTEGRTIGAQIYKTLINRLGQLDPRVLNVVKTA